MIKTRTSGILLHFTSLPSKYPVGDFGPQAYRFADFLKEACQNVWQILPLNYTTGRSGFSPYNCYSAFAGNLLLISPEELCRASLLQQKEINADGLYKGEKADFAKALSIKSKLLAKAFERFKSGQRSDDYFRFIEINRSWLEDFVFFKVFKRKKSSPWSQWPRAIRDRRQEEMKSFADAHGDEMERERFIQYVFTKQYFALKKYCNEKGILLFGDLPIYVTYDSADVWSHPENFKLRADKKPEYIAGVPPDYFSKTGQLWGNPVYDWKSLAERRYGWWLDRLRYNLEFFDLLRIDHFRGFEAYWQVPYGCKNAIKGEWIEGPGANFFDEVLKHIPQPAIVVEDLGYITPGVRELVRKFNFPCMKVLQFAFDGSFTNIHLPSFHPRNSIVYTGTHDNNTTIGWYKDELTKQRRKIISDYLGRNVNSRNINWEMIRLAMLSPAGLSIVPMQDLLGLGSKSRMNNPAKSRNNWLWRMKLDALKPQTARKLKKLTVLCGRC